MGPSNSNNFNLMSAVNNNIPNSLNEQIANLVKDAISKGNNLQGTLDEINKRLNLQDKLIVFYGFQGLLANKFTMIGKEDVDEVKLRCMALNNSISPQFSNIIDFYSFFGKYNKPEGTLIPITLEEAMQELRIGDKLHRNDAEFIDSEVDEFDDNCNEDCLPGGHTCGK